MRTPSGWTLSAQIWLRAICACYALSGAPSAALAAPERLAPTPVVSTPAPGVASSPIAPAGATAPSAPIAPNAPTTSIAPTAPTSTATDSTSPPDSAFFNKRVLTLVALGCLAGLLLGSWIRIDPPETRFRLFNKPKKIGPSILIPSTPVPRLIPGDSPNATRARSTRTPIPRQKPEGIARSGLIDYIAVFSGAGKASDATPVDYLLVPDDTADENTDASCKPDD